MQKPTGQHFWLKLDKSWGSKDAGVSPAEAAEDLDCCTQGRGSEVSCRFGRVPGADRDRCCSEEGS